MPKPFILQGWVIKLNNKGNEIWERTPVYNPNIYDNYFYDIKPTPDKGFICGGVQDNLFSPNPTIPKPLFTLDVAGLPPGLYVAVLKGKDATVSRQFIKR
jgi:hypothetical protein